ncbi:MAG: hypothetical protein IKP73_10210 [Bacteroidales bacterium]|nr:hypothetical protein [Bacteroidales bacterium]
MCDIIKNNIKYIALKALRIAFTISTIISMYEIAISKIIDGNAAIIKTIGILVLTFFCIYVMSFIVVSVFLYLLKNKEVFSTDKHSVFIHFDDLFDNPIVNDKSEPKYIVISVNRCFDTIVNNELISEKTLHGKVLKNLYDEKKYTEETLQATINNNLKHSDYETISKEDKPQGNLRRYNIGTIAKVDDSNTKSYFFLAMSTFDKNLNAHTSKLDYILSIQNLVEYCNKNSQGYPVLMPLLGSGLSRTGLDCYSDILRYLINSLRLNKDIINCDFHIYIRPQDKSKINFYNL